MSNDSSSVLSAITSRIREVFRQNLLPCLLLNLLVLLLVGSYYQVPAMAELWQTVGDFKTRWSYSFSLTSTVFAAVLLPSLAQGNPARERPPAPHSPARPVLGLSRHGDRPFLPCPGMDVRHRQ